MEETRKRTRIQRIPNVSIPGLRPITMFGDTDRPRPKPGWGRHNTWRGFHQEAREANQRRFRAGKQGSNKKRGGGKTVQVSRAATPLVTAVVPPWAPSRHGNLDEGGPCQAPSLTIRHLMWPSGAEEIRQGVLGTSQPKRLAVSPIAPNISPLATTSAIASAEFVIEAAGPLEPPS